jgi:hypothetical protein
MIEARRILQPFTGGNNPMSRELRRSKAQFAIIVTEGGRRQDF